MSFFIEQMNLRDLDKKQSSERRKIILQGFDNLLSKAINHGVSIGQSGCVDYPDENNMHDQLSELIAALEREAR